MEPLKKNLFFFGGEPSTQNINRVWFSDAVSDAVFELITKARVWRPGASEPCISDSSLRIFLIVKGSDADLILAFYDIRCWFFMNLAPEPKYLEIFHKSWFSKRGLDPAGLTSGRGFAGLDADFDNSCVQCLFCVWTRILKSRREFW